MEHENAQILRAIADGKQVQYRSTTLNSDVISYVVWKDFDVKSIESCWSLLTGTPILEWRIAPETIKIGDIEVPEPCREAPEPGQKVWVLTPFDGAAPFHWNGGVACHRALNDGFVHLTKEAARQHYEAIKSLLTK